MDVEVEAYVYVYVYVYCRISYLHCSKIVISEEEGGEVGAQGSCCWLKLPYRLYANTVHTVRPYRHDAFAPHTTIFESAGRSGKMGSRFQGFVPLSLLGMALFL